MYCACCPLCSVMTPKTDLSGLGGYFPPTTVLQGRRSGTWFLFRAMSCSHGDSSIVESSDDPQTIADAWNAWARREALAKAERLGFTGSRRREWLTHLGLEAVDFTKP